MMLKIKFHKKIIFNLTIHSIYKTFKEEIETHTNSLNIDNEYRIKVFEAMEESGGNTEVWLPHFYPAISYYRGTFKSIIGQAAWNLQNNLESENCPPVKLKYQKMFRDFLKSHLLVLSNNAITKIGPLMHEIDLDPEALKHKDEVKKYFYKILVDDINVVEKALPVVFSNYNNSEKYFRESKYTKLAFIVSVIALLSAYRNEIWNFFSKLLNL